jgi:glycosyltransferase involved in cell wall biosynthesis
MGLLSNTSLEDPNDLKMKLLHVVSSMNPAAGGIVSALDSLNGELKQAGHENQVVTLDSPDSIWVKNYQGQMKALGAGTTSYQYHPKLRQTLLDEARSVDACIVHGLWQYPGFAMRSAAQEAGKPYFVFPHGMLDPWFKRTYPFKHLKKSLYWPWGEYRVLRDAACVLFTCEEERLLARESFPKLYRVKEAVVGLGLRDEQRDETVLKERFLSANPCLRGKRILLFLGRLHPKKGLDLLIQAFGKINESHPGLRLVIAGSVAGTNIGPDYLTFLRELANRSCHKNSVIFCGMLEGDEKWAAICAAEVFGLSSHQENFGMAVAEALSCSLPVLVSNKVNIWREIEEDKAGFIAADTLEGTLHSLSCWLDLEEPDRQKHRLLARRCFERRFDVSRVAGALIQTINVASEAKRGVA